MRPHHSTLPGHILALLAGVLVVKVTMMVVSNYSHYFPLDFASDFLRDRESYFFGPYQWAFYTHIVSGPVSLVLGLILIVERYQARLSTWHRFLGWIQVACVLLLVTPSGLWMARHAAAGPIAGVGLAVLAVATAACAAAGARAAATRQFADHRRWMWRCYVLLCSAVVLRLMGGFAVVTGLTDSWFDPLATWLCWLLPLAAFELREWSRR